jgi:hypothetical protein
MKNGVFWVVTPCGSCKNRRFGGTLPACLRNVWTSLLSNISDVVKINITRNLHCSCVAFLTEPQRWFRLYLPVPQSGPGCAAIRRVACHSTGVCSEDQRGGNVDTTGKVGYSACTQTC